MNIINNLMVQLTIVEIGKAFYRVLKLDFQFGELFGGEKIDFHG